MRLLCCFEPTKCLGLRYGDGGEAVDAVSVFLGAVGGEAGGAFLGGPAVEGVAVGFVVVKWDGKSAGFGYAGYVDEDETSGPGIFWKGFEEGCVAFVVGSDDGSFAVKSNDAWWPLEGAKHDENTLVLLEMGDGLGPASGEVLVDDLMGREDAENVSSFRGIIDVTVRGEWGG